MAATMAFFKIFSNGVISILKISKTINQSVFLNEFVEYYNALKRK